MRDHEAELKELRHSIQAAIQAGLAGTAGATGASEPAAAEAPAAYAELDTLLRKLGGHLAAAAEDAEDAVMAHPLSSVGAAFLLGLAIGRLSRRSPS
jgi:ElaB/YqjD/DUF883 family membrane-anchored ribosome-binding protein